MNPLEINGKAVWGAAQGSMVSLSARVWQWVILFNIGYENVQPCNLLYVGKKSNIIVFQMTRKVEKRRTNISHLEKATDWQSNWCKIRTPRGKRFGNVNRVEAAFCASSEYILNQLKYIILVAVTLNVMARWQRISAGRIYLIACLRTEIAKLANSSKRSLVYSANHSKELQINQREKVGLWTSKVLSYVKGQRQSEFVRRLTRRSRNAAVPPQQKTPLRCWSAGLSRQGGGRDTRWGRGQ